MIEFYKKRGETPLQALVRLRKEKSELAKETLSYAGRLDPMAEGILPVLIGEENKNREDFLSKDKEYEATFLIGCKSDTGDILGLIDSEINFETLKKEKIKKAVENLIEIHEQVYPWYSSKTVEGIPLFEYAQKNRVNIIRPVRQVKIYSISNIQIRDVKLEETIHDFITDIKRVVGDFRQEEIVKKWEGVMVKAGRATPAPHTLTITCTLKVSSGTYIRSLCEEIQNKINRPVVLIKLIRTRVF